MQRQSNRAPRPWAWLLLGIVAIALAHTRFGFALAGWLAPIPFLRYLRITNGVRSRAWLVLALAVGWVAALSKIVTAPLPWAFALLGVGYALFQAPGYLTWGWLARRIGRRAGTVGFASVMTLLEWTQHRATPLASWGAAAYTQVEDLPLLQLASLTGLAGVSFVVYLAAAQLEVMLSRWLDEREVRRPLLDTALVALALVLLHAYGAARLSTPGGTSLPVAAVATPATFPMTGLPDRDGRAALIEELVQRTSRAARAGARLAVHTEAALLVYRDEERAMLDTFAQVARREHVHVVIGYIVPLSESPLRFENKLAWFDATGTQLDSYLKHEPAPGEPAVKGTGPLHTFDTDLGRVGSALCYDYDFPALAQQHGRAHADLVALPSSDWRGIDPIHTQMARLRAIENGVSIVRSTRFGLSAAIDPYGRMLAAQSAFDAKVDLLLSALPRRRVPTLYARIGDVFVLGCALALLSVIGCAFAPRLPWWRGDRCEGDGCELSRGSRPRCGPRPRLPSTPA